jgi:hypothetical protein
MILCDYRLNWGTFPPLCISRLLLAEEAVDFIKTLQCLPSASPLGYPSFNECSVFPVLGVLLLNGSVQTKRHYVAHGPQRSRIVFRTCEKVSYIKCDTYKHNDAYSGWQSSWWIKTGVEIPSDSKYKYPLHQCLLQSDSKICACATSLI